MSIVNNILDKARFPIYKALEESFGSFATLVAEKFKLKEADVLKLVREFLKEGTEAASSKSGGFSGKKEKIPKTEKGEIIIVLDYGPRSHAIFGDTMAIKDKILKKLDDKTVSFSKNLKFGPGWTMRGKNKLEIVESAFKKAKVNYRTVSINDFMKELDGSGDEESEKENSDEELKVISSEGEESKETENEKSEEEEVKPKDKKQTNKKSKKTPKEKPTKEDKPKSKKDKEPKAKKTTEKKNKKDDELVEKPSLKKNEWGNFVHKNTGIVFVELPIGVNNNKVTVAVGTQDEDADKKLKALKSVVPLTDTDIDICDENKWRYFKEDMLTIIEKKDPVKFVEITEMIKAHESEDEVEEEEKSKSDEE